MSLPAVVARNLAQISVPGVFPVPDPTANGLAPFSKYPNTIYTTPLPASPILAATSNTVVNNFLNNNGGGPGQDTWNRGMSRYVVHGNSVPKRLVSINQPPKRSWSGPSGTLLCPIPYAAFASQWTTDRLTAIVDIDNDLVYEFWVFGGDYPSGASGPNITPYPDGSWAANTMICCPLNGAAGWYGNTPWASDPTGLGSQISASKISYEGLCITQADMAYVANGGTINHMIGGATLNTGFYIPPAANYDFAYTVDSVPEGSIFTWAPGHVYTATTLLGAAIEHAIGTYGMAMFDTGGGTPTLMIENPSCWWAYAPGNSWQPGLPGLCNWGNNSDNQGRVIMTAGFNWSDLVQVGMRYPSGIVNNDTMPGAPTGLTLSNGTPGLHEITATWTAPGSSGTNPINGYLLYIGPSTGMYDPQNLPYTNGGGLTLTTNASTFTFTTATRGAGLTAGNVIQLVPGDTYYFVVCAITNSGVGPPSTEQSLVCPT